MTSLFRGLRADGTQNRQLASKSLFAKAILAGTCLSTALILSGTVSFAQTTTAEEAAKKKAQQEALKKKYTPSKTSIKSIKKLKKNQAKLTWKKVKNATGYEVYQSMKKNSGYKKVKTITKNKKVTYKAGKLKKKKTYYFKIRTYRKAGGTTYYGNYSNVKKMKVK